MIKLCLDHESFHEKPVGKQISNISKRIAKYIVSDTIDNLAKQIGENGRSFTPATFTNYIRKNENFDKMQLFVLDFDNGIYYKEIEERANKYNLPIAFAYKTFSYTEIHEKFRIVFLFDVVIIHSNIAKLIICMLLRLFPEADQQCSDLARIFFGGKGLLSVQDVMCQLSDCIDAFQKKILETDYSRHFYRTIGNFARKYGVGLNEKKLIDITKENRIFQENGAKLATTYYIYIASVKNAPYFYKIKKNIDIQPQDNNNEPIFHEHFRKSALKKAKNICQLFRDSIVNINSLSHGERFGLISNLRFIEGGEKLFKMMISESDSSSKEWAYQIQYIKKQEYHPMHCKDFCKYCEICNHDTTLFQTLKRIHHFETLSNIPNKYYTLKEAEKDLKNHFIKIMKSNDNDIHIIEAQTALGKTEMYCKYIQTLWHEQKFLVAVPTNLLKNEVSIRMKEMGIPVVSSPSISEFVYLSPNMKNIILELYNKGYDKYVRKKIKVLLAEDCDTNYIDYKMAKRELKEFLDFFDNIKRFDTRVIITTHALLTHMNEDILEGFQIIIDEDILHTICNSQKKIYLNDICDLLKSQKINNHQRIQLEKLLKIPSRRPLIFEETFEEIPLALVNSKSILSNFNNLKMGCVMWKDQNAIMYYYPYKLPNKKIVILSATTNEGIYKQYFSNRHIDYVKCKKATIKGHIIQYPYYNCSRNAFKKNGIKKYESAIRKKYGKIDIITFKKYQLSDYHFGNIEGTNRYENHDIAILGTPHLNEAAYQMLAYVLNSNVIIEKPCYRKIEYNGIRFSFMSYENVLLQNIQTYFISTELEQAVGRARVLRNNCHVYVFSDFPVNQAEIKEEKYIDY